MIDDSLPRFLRTRDAVLNSSDRSLRKRFENGELTRVRSGIYVPTAEWISMDADSRYRTRVAAASHVTQLGTQFSHDSAAAMWRLPSLGAWPAQLHVLGGRSSGAKTSSDLRRHSAVLDASPTSINGMTVTSLARTVLDMSATTTFTRAVGMVDNALRAPDEHEFRGIHSIAPATPWEILELLKELTPYYGQAKARKILAFASGKSGSLGESVSRAQFHSLGLAPPELQVPFYDEDGLIGYVDFYWPELDLIGEFDGIVKYKDQVYLRGQLPEEVVIAEKLREDRLRRVVRAFTRWGWVIATDRVRLERHIAAHGLLRTR